MKESNQENLKKLPGWIVALMCLGPIMVAMYLADQISESFYKSNSSYFVSFLLQVFLFFLAIGVTFLNVVYVDRYKDGVTYSQIISENIEGALMMSGLAVGLDVLSYFANY